MVCPQPTAIVRRCLVELEPGDELEVVGDYPPAKRSIQRSCFKHGFDVREADSVAEGGVEASSDAGGDAETFRLHIRATDEASIEPPADRD
jgi:tRNA 2-thiouridine synthesizing protein A